MSKKQNPIKQEKIRKRAELVKHGVNPYPHKWSKKRIFISKVLKMADSLESKQQQTTDNNFEQESKHSKNKLFHIAGRLMRKRPMGKADFFNIQDETGDFQCYIRRDDFSKSSEASSTTQKETPFPIAKSSDHVQEESLKAQNKQLNPWELWKLCDIGDIIGLSGTVFKTKKGELSLRVKDFQILCKTLEVLPEKYHGLEDKELKYRYRHLDLIMDVKSREVFKTRSKIIQEIRSFMFKKNFMEVETPILQPIYGGAVAEPFETYFRRLNQKMYLKISPEIYLKKLIVGGFEKVFEIGKNFRNEGIDRSHNPEFTMMEYYQAYTDYKDQMKMFEELVCHVTKKIKGSLKFEYQGRELDFTPPWKRITVKEAIKENSKAIHPIDPDTITFKNLFKYVQSLEPKTDLEKFKNFLHQKVLPKDLQEELKDELIAMAFELTVEKELWDPVFITDFPLAVSPLTKKHRDIKQARTVERFEPYIASMELGNAYTELNDPIDQRERLKQQKQQIQNMKKESDKNVSHPVDENFLHAMAVGMPPTGGVGLGIDRLVMILTNQNNIKDSVLFPMLKNK